MESLSVKPRVQGLLTKQPQAIRVAASTAACSLRFHPRVLEQRRSLSWHGHHYGSDWPSRAEAQPQPFTGSAIYAISYEPLRTMRPRSEWSRLRSSGSHRRLNNGDGWSPWGWNKPTWEKELSAEQARFEREFEEFKRRIHADPYGMIFGRRLQRLRPFSQGPKDDTFSSFVRFIFGVDERTASTKGGSNQRGEDTRSQFRNAETHAPRDMIRKSTSGQEAKFQFDPISGRMVPRVGNSAHQDLDESMSSQVIGIPVVKCRSKMANSQNKASATVSSADFTVRQTRDHGSLGQQRSDGVWLMGSPSKEINDSALSSGSISLGDNTSSFPSGSNDTASVEGKTPDHTAPHTHYSLFANFKDYLTSKLETYKHKRSLEKEIEPEDVLRRKLPTARDALFEDPERLNIDSLRAIDVRASFEHRNSELEARNWVAEHGVKSKSLDLSETDKASSTDKSDTVASATAPQDKDKALVDEIRTIYEDAYGKISPTHRHTLSNAKADSSTSTIATKITRYIDTETSTKLAALLPKLENILTETEQANTVVQEFVNDFRKLRETPRSDNQDNASNRPAATQRNVPEEYKILAYDTSTMSVRDAGISSTFSSPFAPLHPVEAISRLNNPSKFLGFFPTLEAQGYEIFSASGDVLVFRKTRRDFESASTDRTDTPPVSASESVHSPGKTAELEEESIEEFEGEKPGSASQTRPTEGRCEGTLTRPGDDHVHSPREAAQLEEESIEEFEIRQPRSTNQPQPKSPPAQRDTTKNSPKQSVHSPSQTARREEESIEEFDNSTLKSAGSHMQSNPVMVRRQETHFTGGPPNWSPYDPDAEQQQVSPPQLPPSPPPRCSETTGNNESHARKILRRVFLAGAATGSTCYAIGVVAEYFRTGGQDGLGPRGFTGLEGR